MSDKKVDLDEVLDKFGLFQPYHRQISLLMIFAFATNALYSANYVFAVEEVNYRCIDQNTSATYCTLTSNDSCSEWVYENPRTLVAEFDLACQDWKRTSVGTAHSLGYMFGLLLVGPISDRIGRKPAVVITGVLGGFFGILRSFSPWYLFYIAMEFLEAALGDSCSPMYVLSLELISKRKKSLIVLICNIGYILGNISFALIAWSVPYWRTFLRVLYTPAFLFLFYLILLDESPRWLLIKGRKDRAGAILEKAAKKNKLKMDEQILDKLSADVEEGVSFNKLLRETFKSKSLRLRFFICLAWWTTSTFVSYGMTINLVFLQGNKYVNYILLSAADLPASLLISYIVEHYKRKKPLIFAFLCGAVFCLSQPFIPSDLPWLSIILFMAGKLMSSFYFSITYLYTSELFPTYTRNSMHALCSSLGRIGSILAPQTPLLIKYWSGLPSFVFGLSALFAGCVTFLVPDIDDASLPDTVHQAEALGKSKELAQTYENCNEGTNISRL